MLSNALLKNVQVSSGNKAILLEILKFFIRCLIIFCSFVGFKGFSRGLMCFDESMLVILSDLSLNLMAKLMF